MRKCSLVVRGKGFLLTLPYLSTTKSKIKLWTRGRTRHGNDKREAGLWTADSQRSVQTAWGGKRKQPVVLFSSEQGQVMDEFRPTCRSQVAFCKYS